MCSAMPGFAESFLGINGHLCRSHNSAGCLQYYLEVNPIINNFDAAPICTSNHVGHIRSSSDDIRLESSTDRVRFSLVNPYGDEPN
jgi:hypothetical protein